MRSLIKLSLCFVLAVLLPIDPNLVQQWVASARAQEAAKQAKEPTAEDLKKMADKMERAFKALEVVEKEIPHDTFDPKAIVDKVGRDPVKLFEWVRDNTFWVPYQGCLRGHIGVLMDRLGSSLDRALLLSELLRTAGHQVRLARAELSEEQAKELLQKIRAVPNNPLPSTQPPRKEEVSKLIEKYAKQYELDAVGMKRGIGKISLQAARIGEEVAQRVAEQVPALVKAVGKPSDDAAALRSREAAHQLASLRDHWWVQCQDHNTWEDFDPLLPDAQPNGKLAAAKEIIAPDKKDGKLHLHSKYCHEIVIKIVIEELRKGHLTEKTVFDYILRPSDLFGARIALNHYPMKWTKDLDFLKEKKSVEKLKSMVLAQDEWLPILDVGTKKLIQSSFTDSADTIDKPLAPLMAGAAPKLGANIRDILGGGKIGDAPARKPATNAFLTAEWIEYDVRVPGQQKPTTIRRQIFDLIGPKARSTKKVPDFKITESQRLERSLALLAQVEILTLPCQLSPEFVNDLVARRLLDNAKVLPNLVRQGESLKSKVWLDQLGKVVPLPSQLYTLALARREWSRFRGDVYLDRVNIVSHKTSIHHNQENQLLLCHGFDIIANDVAVRSTSATEPFLLRVEQGVLDTNVEALLLTRCGKVQNTAEIFAMANRQGNEWLTIRTPRDETWKEVNLPIDIRARIEKDLAAGYVILVPKRPSRLNGQLVVGWWRVDPRTGLTLGIGDVGGGSATEHHLLHEVIFTVVGVVLCVYVFGHPLIWFCVLVGAAELGLGLATGSASFATALGIILETGYYAYEHEYPGGPYRPGFGE